MSEKAFSKMMRGLKEAKAFMEGEREGYKVTVPPSVDVKSIRKGLRMTQAVFSESFGFRLDAVKHWEGGRRTSEVPARAISPSSSGTRPPSWKPCVRTPSPSLMANGQRQISNWKVWRPPGGC